MWDFKNNQTVDNIESVPSDFRGLYREGDDGKFKLGSEDAGISSAVGAIVRLSNSLNASRAEAKGYKEQRVDLSALSDYGATVEEIVEGVNTRITEVSKGKGAKSADEIKVQVEKIKEDLAKGHKVDVEARDIRIAALTGQLHKLLVVDRASTALRDAGAIDPALVLPHLAGQIKVTEEEGDFKVHVVDEAKDIRYSGTTGAPLSIPELVAEMKGTDKYKPLFQSEAPSGGGTKPVVRPVGAVTTGSKDNRTSVQKIADGLRKQQHTVS